MELLKARPIGLWAPQKTCWLRKLLYTVNNLVGSSLHCAESLRQLWTISLKTKRARPSDLMNYKQAALISSEFIDKWPTIRSPRDANVTRMMSFSICDFTRQRMSAINHAARKVWTVVWIQHLSGAAWCHQWNQQQRQTRLARSQLFHLLGA